MLLALTSAGRASDIAYLDTRYLIKHPTRYIFQFGKNTKTSTRTRQKKPLKFYSFRENKNLCVCHPIDLYLDKMREFHKIETQLLLRFIKPHKGVTFQTISRWILEVFDSLGIITEVFTGHSTRSGSTSKVKASSVSSNDVIKRRNWTQNSTFEKFYQKEILPEGEEFRSNVLKQPSREVVPAMTFSLTLWLSV